MPSFENVSPKIREEKPGGYAEQVVIEGGRRKKPAEEGQEKEEISGIREKMDPMTENVLKLQEYANTTIEQAKKTLAELKRRITSRDLNASSFEFLRSALVKNGDYLMQLQQYSMKLDDRPGLRGTVHRIYEYIGDIEDTIAEGELALRQKEYDKTLAHFPPKVERTWDKTEPSSKEEASLLQDSAALASKFNASAAKIDKQKKSLWGRVKSWFS